MQAEIRRLVVRLACRYVRRGCNLEDLIAEGNVGLLKAADRYDPARNTRFSTYAFYWIRLAIQQVLSTLKTIRVSNHMAALVARWDRTAAGLCNELGRTPTDDEVARRLRQEERFANTTLVALTGYGREGDIQRSRGAGFDHHLVKPVDLGEVEKLLSSAGRSLGGNPPETGPHASPVADAGRDSSPGR